jgi:hypothetical protein
VHQALRSLGSPARPPEQPEEPSSSRLAERSRRQQRRERDRRAERAAVFAVIVVFLGLGGGLYFLFNSDILNGPAPTPPKEQDDIDKRMAEAKAAAAKAEQKKNLVSHLDETPDIPALRSLASEGLTIAAEGLPEVLAEDGSARSAVIAALQTCRFAYGVWEFSPNKRFRFLTTCSGLAGQILVGAYEVEGSTIKMSPLIDGDVAMVSVFEVEKPSRLTSQALVKQGDQAVELRVNQRVTIIRSGLHGEAFRDNLAPANTLEIPGQKKGEGPPPAPKQGRDPLLDLIKKGGSSP